MGNTQTMTGNLAFEDIWATLLVTDRKLKEAAEKVRETNERMQNIAEEMEKRLSKPGRKIDDVFILRVERQFGALGIVFERSAERTLFGNRVFPERYAEIDVFLENRHKAVAVAVKPQPAMGGEYGETTATIGDIRGHLERMEKLRRCFDLNKDRRKLYGAIAAAVFPAEVMDFALARGLYVIEYSAEHIEVREPASTAKAW